MFTKTAALAALMLALGSFTATRQTEQDGPRFCTAAHDESLRGGNWTRNLYQGQDGYLFSAGHLAVTVEVTERERLIQELQRFNQALQSRGVTLVTLHLPSATMLYTDFFPGDGERLYTSDEPLKQYFEHDQIERRLENYHDLIRIFNEAGIHAPNIYERIDTMPEKKFYTPKAGDHFSATGGKIVANVVANFVKTLPVAQTLPEETFVSEFAETEEVIGSLAKRAMNVCPDITLPAETLPRFETRNVTHGDPGQALFKESSVEAVLVGTSFSDPDSAAGRRGNLDGFLSEFLSTPVSNYALVGGGVWGSMRDYLRSNDFHDNPPTILFWEIPFDRGALSLGDMDETAAALQEVVPSVYGACPLRQSVWNASSSVVLQDELAFEELGADFLTGDYLHYRLSNVTLRELEVTFSYGDSERVSVPVVRPARSRTIPNEFFLEVPRPNAPLSSVAFTFNDDVSTTIDLRLCKTSIHQVAEGS